VFPSTNHICCSIQIIYVSTHKTCAQYWPLVPRPRQSMPSLGFFSRTWRDLMIASVCIGGWPEFSVSARGILSSASEKARIAYCSNVEICARQRDNFINNMKEWNQICLLNNSGFRVKDLSLANLLYKDVRLRMEEVKKQQGQLEICTHIEKYASVQKKLG